MKSMQVTIVIHKVKPESNLVKDVIINHETNPRKRYHTMYGYNPLSSSDQAMEQSLKTMSQNPKIHPIVQEEEHL